MSEFTDADILQLDERFAHANIPFYDRPNSAIQELLGERLYIGVERSSQAKEIERAYKRLIPEVEFPWSGLNVGLVVS